MSILLENSECCNCLFHLIPHSPVFFFLFVKTIKEWMTERKETEILFNSTFVFGVYDNFLMKTFFWTSRNGRASWSRCLRNFRNHFWQISVNLRVYYMCLCSVSMFSWGCCEPEAQRIVRPEAFANMCAPTGFRERKVRPFSRSTLKEQRMSFSLAPEGPTFLACANFTSC